MITADQLVCHGVGDYILQSDWMATTKTKKSIAALAHVVTYTLPFLMLTQSWKALLFIAGTHFVIDRWRLARYVVWAKNWLAPCWENFEYHEITAFKRPTPPFSECRATGYSPTRPDWMVVWLLIIADNLMHVILNGVALKYLIK